MKSGISMARKFEEIEIGESRESYGRTVSESDVYRFAGLEGHYGELHTNKEYAEQTDYGGRIAHGGLLVVLVQGFMASIGWNYDTYALYGFDTVRFIDSVLIGDTVHLESELVDKEIRDEDTGKITISCELKKSDGTVAMAMDWMILINREE